MNTQKQSNSTEQIEHQSENVERQELSENIYEVNSLQYLNDTIPVTKFDTTLPHKVLKIPFVAVEVLLMDSEKKPVLAMFDTGCTSSMISETFAQTLPLAIRRHNTPLNQRLGMANNASSRITGKIELPISYPSNPLDQYPIIVQQTFHIATDLHREMFLGADFICNHNVILSMDTNTIQMNYPRIYHHNRDPYDDSDYKIIPFVYMNTHEASMITAHSLTLKPFETTHMKCQVEKRFRGKEVIVRNLNEIIHDDKQGSFANQMPNIHEKVRKVDKNGSVIIELSNQLDNDVKIPFNVALGKVSIKQDEINSKISEITEICSENKLLNTTINLNFDTLTNGIEEVFRKHYQMKIKNKSVGTWKQIKKKCQTAIKKIKFWD